MEASQSDIERQRRAKQATEVHLRRVQKKHPELIIRHVIDLKGEVARLRKELKRLNKVVELKSLHKMILPQKPLLHNLAMAYQSTPHYAIDAINEMHALYVAGERAIYCGKDCEHTGLNYGMTGCFIKVNPGGGWFRPDLMDAYGVRTRGARVRVHRLDVYLRPDDFTRHSPKP